MHSSSASAMCLDSMVVCPRRAFRTAQPITERAAELMRGRRRDRVRAPIGNPVGSKLIAERAARSRASWAARAVARSTPRASLVVKACSWSSPRNRTARRITSGS